MEEPQTNPAFKLLPLKPEQHPVTRVPKRTTELPFFYFTKKKDLLKQPIRYEGIDEFGHPMRWFVTPNPAIGAPAIEAHEVWQRLVMPAIEQQRAKLGRVPEILPLGGVRQALRALGWTEGGRTARRLLHALRKIRGAECDADYLLPRYGNGGQVTFTPVKGIYSRFTIYAIGDK